ncbi:hypothetical protein SDC9_100300 [bioreactor metagenome]|uniref:IrrE N-terminal-like domain-containing protein n=1 Tax=bioreactor metagenome TaxID=1076179 RepID=A0A645AJY6_9ZZZZ
MQRLFDIYEELYGMGVKLYNSGIEYAKSLTIELNGRYAIFIEASAIESMAEEACIIAHEAGHITTGATHYISSPFDLIEKHEHKAFAYSVIRLVPKAELDQAVRRGLSEVWQLADYFNLPEEFMANAIEYYKITSGV